MMLDGERAAGFGPIGADGTHAMRADGYDFLDLVLRQQGEVFFGELLEQ